MTYQNFKTLAQLKKQFKQDMQYLSTLSFNEIMQQAAQFEQYATSWVFNFCTVERITSNYVNLFWTSEKGTTYDLMRTFKQFVDYYNQLLNLINEANKLCNIVDDVAKENVDKGE